MKKIQLSLFVLLSSLLTSCGMNSQFSCNVTAGDSCLTIEQVDAMTRYADGPCYPRPKPKHKKKKVCPKMFM